MTVAYSAYSKTEKKFVMGADNLEGNSGAIVSKIRTVIGRFAFCVTGSDNPIHAFDGMRRRCSDKDFEKGWFNIREAMGDLASWTKDYTEGQVRQHAHTPEVQRCLANPADHGSTVIIFDAKTFELFELEMDIYSPSAFNPRTAKRTILRDGVLHLHAMAANRTNQVTVARLPSNIFSDSKKELEALIDLDKKFHDNKRLTQPDLPRIGDLGSYCFFKKDRIVYMNLTLKKFIFAGRLEGISFLVLLLIAMPLKYIWEIPEAVRWVGSAHGALFVLYVCWSFYLMQKRKWGADRFITSVILASLPFGTFYFERKYLS